MSCLRTSSQVSAIRALEQSSTLPKFSRREALYDYVREGTGGGAAVMAAARPPRAHPGRVNLAAGIGWRRLEPCLAELITP